MSVARGHPRHLLLGALVAGLLASPHAGAVLVVAAVLVAVARSPRLGLAVAATVLLGATLAQARLASLDQTALRPHLGDPVTLRGFALERPRAPGGGQGRGGQSALVRVEAGPGAGERVSVKGRWPAVAPGHEVVLAGRLEALDERDAWLRRRGAHARVVAWEVRATGRRRGGPAGVLDRLRERAERDVAEGLDAPQAALARGMVLGQDEALEEGVRDDFRASGLAHLLAASGQNVMLLVALALPVLSVLGFGLRGRLGGALALVALYVPLAGASASIQRAGVMGAAGLVAVLASRPASRWYALLLAAAATLLVNPRAAGDPGWQLSFAAVLAILALAAPMAVRLRARGVPRGLAEAVALTAAATLGTAPLLAFHFERISLVSLPANLLAVVAVAPAMWLGMLAVVAGYLAPPLAAAPNALAQLPLAYLGWLAHAAAGVPYASVPLRISSPVALAATYAGVVAAAAAVLRGSRLHAAVAAPAGIVRRGLVVAVVLVAALALVEGRRMPAPPDPRDVVVSFLDVGQGDATLVQHGGATVLVDTGPPGSGLLDRLREAGVRRIDLLVLTHSQADHDGGAADVLRRLPVGHVLDGGQQRTEPHRRALEAAAERRVPRLVPDAGQTLRAGALRLRVLWPRHEEPPPPGGDPNDRAIVAVLSVGDFDLLLPADAESNVTAALDLPRVEALKVAHHGSEDPGTADLLTRLRPRLAVIEVGRGNPFGHPTPGLLAALRPVPAVYRTDRDGTVRLTVHAGRMSVETAR